MPYFVQVSSIFQLTPFWINTLLGNAESCSSPRASEPARVITNHVSPRRSVRIQRCITHVCYICRLSHTFAHPICWYVCFCACWFVCLCGWAMFLFTSPYHTFEWPTGPTVKFGMTRTSSRECETSLCANSPWKCFRSRCIKVRLHSIQSSL